MSDPTRAEENARAGIEEAPGRSCREEVLASACAVEPEPVDREASLLRELTEQQRRASEWERSYKAAMRDAELATALAGRPLVPGAAAQLVKLWRDDFDVYEERGVLKVAARDGRSVNQAIGERLAAPEYAHFCQAASRGGSATPGGTRSGFSGSTVPTPRTLGEAAILRWREGVGRHEAGVAPIGLHPRRR